MPNTKNALIRQRIIDKCLSSSRNYSIKDLMNACNKELESIGEDPVTATNTIREDLNQIMANYPDAVIIPRREGRNIYYSYEDDNYSIFNIPFTDEELAQLTQTLSVLSRFEGMPQFEWVEDLMVRFKSSLNIDSSRESFVGFEENIDLKGRGFFAKLFAAINEKQVLVLKYRNFKRKTDQEFIVHPYYLKEYNNRWFLCGYSENINKYSIFALDRIVSIENKHTEYIPNSMYDYKEYFDDMIGVSKNDFNKIETVKIWISPFRWPYVATKPLHGTQKIVSHDEDTGTVIQIKVYLNRELEQRILSFGQDMRVLEPRELKDRILSNLRNACKNYE